MQLWECARDGPKSIRIISIPASPSSALSKLGRETSDQATNINVDSTLNPGSRGKEDMVRVTISCDLAHGSLRGNAKANFNIQLPSGTIVKNVEEAERIAYEQAAEIMAQLSDAARKEAQL